MRNLRDPEDWDLQGRGRELQFFATDAEIRDALVNGLPRELRPYLGIGLDNRTATTGALQRPPMFSCDVVDLLESAKDYRSWIGWIASTALTPRLEPSGGDFVGAWSVSGLILFEPPLVRKGRREEARIAIVDRVRKRHSREVELNGEYLAAFRSLERYIKRRLRWSTLHTLADGTVEEDASLRLMTDAAAEAARALPDEWAVQPARPLSLKD